MTLPRMRLRRRLRTLLFMVLLPVSASAGGLCGALGGDANKLCEKASDKLQPVITAADSAAQGMAKTIQGAGQAAGGLGKVLTGNKEGWNDVGEGVKNMATGAVVVATSGSMIAIAAADPLIGTVFFNAPSPLQGVAKFLYDTISRWKGKPDCNPQEQVNRLMTVPKKTLGDGDKLAGVFTTPAKYILSIWDGSNGWEATGCDAVGTGQPVREAQVSTDGLWTVDLKLLSLDVQGTQAPEGRYLRLEIMPDVPAHTSASRHPPTAADVFRFSGPMIWDKDTDDEHPHGHMEVHPYAELVPGVKDVRDLQQDENKHKEEARNESDNAQQKATPGPSEYQVEKGDSLSKIAEHFYGDQRWPIVFCANKAKINDPDLIYPGQQFRLPLPGEEGKKCLISKR